MEIQKSVNLNDESKIHSPITFNRAMKGGKKTHPSTLINKLTISEVADAISPPLPPKWFEQRPFPRIKSRRKTLYLQPLLISSHPRFVLSATFARLVCVRVNICDRVKALKESIILDLL